MEIKPAERISSVKPYFFAELEKRIAELKKTGLNIIRLDMGSPDLPPADNIIETLINAVRRPDVHGYGPSGGTASLKSAFAQYYQTRFGVDLDPDREVITLIGSKEGIYNINQALINPGDLILLPDPCYPVYQSGALISQAETYAMPLLAENGFLPNLESIPEKVIQKAKLMWLNYPNNPTGAIAPISFFKKVVDFARQTILSSLMMHLTSMSVLMIILHRAFWKFQAQKRFVLNLIPYQKPIIWLVGE